MLPDKRVDTILAILAEEGFAQVPDLARRLAVSEMTIRRDLDRCEARGLLRRVHGGASLPDTSQGEVSFESKQDENHVGKLAIAAHAAQLVRSGMSVYLDAGTTCYEIATLLREKRDITVVTNDLRTAAFLLGSSINLLLIGGQVQHETGSMIGPAAERDLNDLLLDIAFVGAMSIDERFRVLTPTVEKAYFKRHVCRQAGSSFLVADESKFGRKSLVVINGLQDYTGVITNKSFTKAESRLLYEMQANIITVPE